jgi:ankyrin repeat protein
MADPAAPHPLPEKPSLEWLRKEAKRLLAALRETHPSAQLADAQFELAKRHGFASWRALKAHVDSLGETGRLFEMVKRGEVAGLRAALDARPQLLHARKAPYQWTLLHAAAQLGNLAIVDLLLQRGLDVNKLEDGDQTVALHWAAAAGHVDVVKRLIAAGSDVIGEGDDHGYAIIGWASCWDGSDTPRHREVVRLLLEAGARHTIYSAIALDLEGEVRRIVADDQTQLHRRLPRTELNSQPLHFAVKHRRPGMVQLLLALGADPLAVDAEGQPATTGAEVEGVDRPIMERIRDMVVPELDSARRGQRPPNARMMDLLALVSLGEWGYAEQILTGNPKLLDSGVLHLMAKRGNVAAVRWLLARGANPNARWGHWDAQVTPLHLAALGDHPEVVPPLLDSGADPRIRDSVHDGDALGWAEFFHRPAIIRLLREREGTA